MRRARKRCEGPELLAPAGGPAALRAAVAAGADAVYLGTSEFNARRGAENFPPADLAEACRFAHLRGVRVYLTANVVVLEDEMPAALAMVARAWEAGVDAVIVQDLGLLRCVRESLPEVRVHASTQIDAHNAATVGLLASLGVSRVTLARELSIEEIAALVRGVKMRVELESFVHGSLCFSHSGQCLMSSMIGARSANRGMCAQPCRLPYGLARDGAEVATATGEHLLSPKDLAGITRLPDLVRSHVAALKIEGRMKAPEYVAAVTAVYRSALDRAVADPDGFSVTEAEMDTLAEAFNRGFTEGYLSDIRDDRMMSHARPNNRGVSLGRVAGSGEGRATVALDRALEAGDTIEFWTSSGRFAQQAGEMDVGGTRALVAPAGSRATLTVSRPVRTGDRVFRVANAALLDALRRSYQGDIRPVGAAFAVRLRIGEPAELTVEIDGHRAVATGQVVEAARTRAVTAEDVMEHVGRLGGSGYETDSWSLELDPNVGIGFSALHALRREALEDLDDARLAAWVRRPLPKAPTPPSIVLAPRRVATLRVVAAVSDARVARACLEAGADEVLQVVSPADGPGHLAKGAVPLLPRVAHERDAAALLAFATTTGRATAGNLGLLAACAKAGVVTAADWGLNAVNPWTVDVLAQAGASFVWASPELSGRQLAALCARSSLPVGLVVHGRLELMVAEHCVLSSAGECEHECASCARRSRTWELVDRKGYRFPVTTDRAGYAHVYNSVPLDLARALPEIVEAGVAALRLELHTATPQEASAAVRAWRRAAGSVLAGDDAPGPSGERTAAGSTTTTSGHFFRGVH